MTEAEAKTLIFDVLASIAPEADPSTLSKGENMRDAFDLDSMDFLNFIIALHDRTGLAIPEADYPRLLTLEGAIAYLTQPQP